MLGHAPPARHASIRSERERVARDLHDGLAQDLACITTQAQRLDCDLGPHHPLMLATRDALGELRGADCGPHRLGGRQLRGGSSADRARHGTPS